MRQRSDGIIGPDWRERSFTDRESISRDPLIVHFTPLAAM